MGSRAVRAQLYKHLDVERKVAKQAEARLKQRLQQLEAARLRRLAQLAREQRQLQAQRQRLWEGIVRKKRSSYFGNGIQKRPEAVRVSPPQGAWTHGAPQAGGVRAPATNMAQETHKPKSQMPPSCHTGLRDPTVSKEPSPPQNRSASYFRKDRPPARKVEAPRPAKGCPAGAGISALCRGQGLPAGTADPGPGAGPAGDGDEARSGAAGLQPDLSVGERVSPRPPGCAGTLKGESSGATYLELCAKAGRAHYLRHRLPPESERLLSIGEIFGHGGPVPQGREGGSRAAAQATSCLLTCYGLSDSHHGH